MLTPVVLLLGVVALILLPLSLVWLLTATEWVFSLNAFTSHPVKFTVFLILLSWTLIGVFEVLFSRSNLRRNYPVLANLRYLLEFIRPEIQQYFIANNTEE
ncbi:MAG: hypothetical protein RKH07_00005, partial [Gammaproteobacteria bacterium]